MKMLALTLIALAAALAPASAGADGLPLPIDGADDASVAGLGGGPFRYAAVSNGGATTVLQIVADGGRITRSRTLGGEFSIPLVAYDGTASGLSANGERLALISPRPSFPRRSTDLRILDTADLRPVQAIHLDGDFSFDAISPDGRRIYLVHYKSADPTNYEVRAYDVARGRLLQAPIVDPDEPDEQMAGFPMARKVSPDGRWAYTLYSGNDTFIHALDTAGNTAVCVDLSGIPGRDMWDLALNLDPATGVMTVLDQSRPIAVVDPQTFAVTDPPDPAAAPPPAETGGDGWIGWAALGGGVIMVVALAGLLWWRRRPEQHVDEDELERLVRVDATEREAADAEREPVS